MFNFFKNSRRRRPASGRKANSSRRRRHSFESLENRQLMAADVIGGSLVVTGDDFGAVTNDKIEISTTDNVWAVVKITDRLTGLPTNPDVPEQRFLLSSFTNVSVDGRSGDDQIEYKLNKISTLIGGIGHDNIQGGDNVDIIVGGAGNDIIRGGKGHDVIEGGSGDDHLLGQEGNDTFRFIGSNLGFDEFYENANEAADVIDLTGLYVPSAGQNASVYLNLGRTDVQTVFSVNGVDHLKLRFQNGADIENFVGSIYRDVVIGNSRDNYLQGWYGNDVLGTVSGPGSVGNDILEGGFGNDWLAGGEGNDTYRFGHSSQSLGEDIIVDSLQVNAGTDTLDFTNFAKSVSVDLRVVDEYQVVAENHLSIMLSAFSPIENVIGSAFADTITGSSINNSLNGMAGDDTLRGGDGADQLEGGADDDYLDGGYGNDHLSGDAGNDFVYGWYGVDYIHFSGNVNLGHDTLPDWFDSGDMLDFSGFSQGVKLNLNVNTDTEQTLAANLKLTIYHPWTVTHVMGSQLLDMIDGNGRDNVIHGLSGNDIISGHGGDDFLSGSFGDDIISGGSGNDVLFGSFGYDRLYGDSGDDTLDGGDDDIADLLVGGSGHDKFWAEWEYSYVPVKNTPPFVNLLKWNRDKPADFDSSRDQILG